MPGTPGEIQNLIDIIKNPSTISRLRLDASTAESAQVTTSPETEHYLLSVSHALKITCLAVCLVVPSDELQQLHKWNELFEAVTRLVYESVGITSLSEATGPAASSTIVAQLTRAIQHSANLQEVDSFATIARCCLCRIRWVLDLRRYVLHPALDLFLINFY